MSEFRGRSGSKSAVTVTPTPHQPSVTISSPANQTVAAAGVVSVSWSVTDAIDANLASVAIVLNGSAVATVVVSGASAVGATNVTIPADTINRAHKIEVVATDTTGFTNRAAISLLTPATAAATGRIVAPGFMPGDAAYDRVYGPGRDPAGYYWGFHLGGANIGSLTKGAVFSFVAEAAGSFDALSVYLAARDYDTSGSAGSLVYAAGTGGKLLFEVRADDGTALHRPNMTGGGLLGYARIDDSCVNGYTVAPYSGPNYHAPILTFVAPVTLAVGTRYHIVATNTDATPGANYRVLNTTGTPKAVADRWYATGGRDVLAIMNDGSFADEHPAYANHATYGPLKIRPIFALHRASDARWIGIVHQTYDPVGPTQVTTSGAVTRIAQRFTPTSNRTAQALSALVLTTAGCTIGWRVTSSDHTSTIYASGSLTVAPNSAYQWIDIDMSSDVAFNSGSTYYVEFFPTAGTFSSWNFAAFASPFNARDGAFFAEGNAVQFAGGSWVDPWYTGGEWPIAVHCATGGAATTAAGWYGVPGFTSLANTPLDAANVRVVTTLPVATTGAITRAKLAIASVGAGAGYGQGTGGTITGEVYRAGVDGLPTGALLATCSVPSPATDDVGKIITFSSAINGFGPGDSLAIRWRNEHGTPASNFCSINGVLCTQAFGNELSFEIMGAYGPHSVAHCVHYSTNSGSTYSSYYDPYVGSGGFFYAPTYALEIGGAWYGRRNIASGIHQPGLYGGQLNNDNGVVAASPYAIWYTVNSASLRVRQGLFLGAGTVDRIETCLAFVSGSGNLVATLKKGATTIVSGSVAGSTNVLGSRLHVISFTPTAVAAGTDYTIELTATGTWVGRIRPFTNSALVSTQHGEAGANPQGVGMFSANGGASWANAERYNGSGSSEAAAVFPIAIRAI